MLRGQNRYLFIVPARNREPPAHGTSRTSSNTTAMGNDCTDSRSIGQVVPVETAERDWSTLAGPGRSSEVRHSQRVTGRAHPTRPGYRNRSRPDMNQELPPAAETLCRYPAPLV